MDFFLEQMPREKFVSNKPRIISMPEIKEQYVLNKKGANAY
jgi:hypothetical protein